MTASTMLLKMMLVLLECCSQSSESLRILAIFPLNSKSHDVVCDSLARGLAAKGHQLDVFSHFPPKKHIPNYKHHNLDEGSVTPITNNMNYSRAVNIKPGSPREILNSVGIPSCRLMELPMLQKIRKNPPMDPAYDLVIIEGFVTDCYLAWGRHLDVPMVGVMTTAIIDWYIEELGNPFNTAVTPTLGASVSVPMNFFDRLKNTMMNIFIKTLFTQAIRDQNQVIGELFGPGYPDIVELRHDLDLLIINSHHSLDGVRPFTPAIVPAAGMHIDDQDVTKLPTDVQKWLDDSKDGCIYFSFGSMVLIETFPKAIIAAFYATFKNIAPVRVLLKIANPKDLPPGLPANVMIKSWFPQFQVLKHKNTKAFVTHGGLMSAQESIYCGVPMVGIPIFGDQFGNVESNVNKGIATAVQLTAIDEEKLTAAVKAVLHDPSFKQNAEKLSRLFVDRPMKPLDTAVFWVEYVARHGKGCLRSPLVDMPWWQANLLDVYAFIAFVLLVIYFVLKCLVKKLYKVCFSSKEVNPPKKLESKKKR